jgi:hypothetical protein
MNKNLGKLIALGLDYELFWSVSVDEYSLQVRGMYSKRLENYVLSRGFEKYDWIYADNPKEYEFKNVDGCRILLSKK